MLLAIPTFHNHNECLREQWLCWFVGLLLVYLLANVNWSGRHPQQSSQSILKCKRVSSWWSLAKRMSEFLLRRQCVPFEIPFTHMASAKLFSTFPFWAPAAPSVHGRPQKPINGARTHAHTNTPSKSISLFLANCIFVACCLRGCLFILSCCCFSKVSYLSAFELVSMVGRWYITGYL